MSFAALAAKLQKWDKAKDIAEIVQKLFVKGGKLDKLMGKLDEIVTVVRDVSKTPADEVAKAVGRFGCFVAETPCWVASPALAKAVSVATDSVEQRTTALSEANEAAVAIKDIQLGQRVSAANPQREEVGFDAANEGCIGWKTISLEVRHANGAVVDVELLRSLEWIERNGLRVGE